MALALYVLAGAMAIGGLAAMYFGSDIIVMERGWTMDEYERWFATSLAAALLPGGS